MADISFDEIAGACSGMDKAEGSNNPTPPPNSSVVVKFTKVVFDRTKNTESKLNGCMYCLIEADVIETSTAECPVGSKTKVIFSGLDARINMQNGKSNLAESAKADMRAALAAAFGLQSGAAAPPIPATPDNPNPQQTWISVANFLSKYPENLANLRPVRVVSGPLNKKGTYTSRQYVVV